MSNKPTTDRRCYNPHEIEAGLRLLVVTGGSARRASEMCEIPRATLASWLIRHRERLEAIRVEEGPRLERMAIEAFRGFIVAAEDAKLKALAATIDQLDRGDCRDPSRAMQNVAAAQGLAVQRMLELDGRPQGVEPDQRSVSDILTRLERMGAVRVRADAESTATELPAVVALDVAPVQAANDEAAVGD